MKRFFLILLAVIICGAANSQTLKKGKNDLERNNLKGNVVSVTEYSCVVNEAFGEWEKGERFPSRMSVFNEKGNYILYTEEPILISESSYTDYITGIGRVPVIKTVQLYRYNDSGKLASINCVYGESVLRDPDNLVNWYFKASQNMTKVKSYDYNSDGTIKSITSEITKVGGFYSEDNLGICGKEVFKYDADGPEIWFYESDGSRDTDKTYKVLTKDRCIIKRGDHGLGVEMYNEKGQMIARQRNATLINGKFKADIYYDYNEHGELRVVANNTQATGSIKGYESLYPFIGDKINETTVRCYEYEYDSMGNWTVRKEFSIRDKEVIVSGWEERDIKYAGDGPSGKELVDRLMDGVDGLGEQKRSEQEAEDEYRSRPEYPELTEEFLGWLQSKFTYPGAETPLGSILAAYGSSLKIRLLLELTPDGTFTPPTSFLQASRYTDDEALTWDLRNNKTYILQTSAEKEEKKAQIQIEQILDKMMLDLKDAPAVSKGRSMYRTSVTVVFKGGQVIAEEGY